MSKRTIELECACCKGTGKIKETVWLRARSHCAGCYADQPERCALGYERERAMGENWSAIRQRYVPACRPVEPCPRPTRARLFEFLKKEQEA